MMSSFRRWLLQHLRTWYGTIMLLATLGCGIGITAFFLAALDGVTLFTVVGGLAGVFCAIGLLVLQRSRSRLELREIKIAIGGSEATFMVNARYRKAAWKLFVETMTRVATQPLDDGQGCLREAMSSLHSLFQTSRDLLKEMEPTPTTEGNTVEMLALEMLNSHIRPFLSYWHPRLAEYEESHDGASESEWADGEQMRAALQSVRGTLVEYVRMFGQLAGVQQLDRFFEGNIVTSQSTANRQDAEP